MVEAQEGKCAICHEPPNARARKNSAASKGWEVDHGHDTGAVRELLCGPCNRGLAAFRDDPEALREAANYIERHSVKI